MKEHWGAVHTGTWYTETFGCCIQSFVYGGVHEDMIERVEVPLDCLYTPQADADKERARS